jgi:hypothetical protein
VVFLPDTIEERDQPVVEQIHESPQGVVVRPGPLDQQLGVRVRQNTLRAGESHEGHFDFRRVVAIAVALAIAPSISADSVDLARRKGERHASPKTSYLGGRIAIQADGQPVAVNPFQQAHRLKEFEAVRFAVEDAY